MFCPKCAAQNADGTKFCRVCGANISLVAQAMTGRLPDARATRKHKRHENPPDLSEGIIKLFMGFGFMLVSFAVMLYAPAGRLWWFWLLLPAFGMMGKGVAEIVMANRRESQHLPPMIPDPRTHYQQPPGVAELPPRNTGPVFPPPSVTEQTTRHLDSTLNRPKE